MEKNKKPAIRFKGFTEEWEERKLGETVDVRSGCDYKHLSKGNIPVYGTGGYMLSVNKALSYSEDAIGIGRKGTIDKPYILKSPFWTVDTLFYAVPRTKVDLEFVLCLFLRINWKKKDESTGVPSLSKQTINSVDIITPTFNEQIKIGDFFRNLDHLIFLYQYKYDKLQNFKKSMLEKMFTQNESSIPEIRFKGFTEVWEKRKLNEYLETSTEKNTNDLYSKQDVLSVSGDFGIINQIEFQGRSFAGVSVLNYGIVNVGDVVYTKSPLSSNPYGIIKANKGKAGIVSTLYAIYHTTEQTEPNFVQVYFEQNARVNNYLHPLVNKGAKNDMKVTADNALKGMVIFPKYEEQKQISEFFSVLDHLITLHKHKLEKLQNIKKACLEKMFV